MDPDWLQAQSSGSFVYISLIWFEEGGLDSVSSDTWYRCRRDQEDGRWYDKVLGWASQQRPVDWLPRTPLVRFSCIGAALAALLISSCCCMFIFYVIVRLCSSPLILPERTYFVVYVLALVLFVSCLISFFFVFISLGFFRSYHFSGGVICCLLVPGTIALDLRT